MKLNGKVALVTGGGTGIGAAATSRFIAEGAKVCIVGRRREVLEQFAKTLPPERILACAGDISNPMDIQRVVDETVAWGGTIDVLVNNAATEAGGSVVDTDLALWNKSLATNLTGPFLLMKLCIPLMIKRGGGSIINIASLAGIRSIPEHAGYCASKAALIHLTRQVALDFGHYRIRCNVIVPGAVRTPQMEQSLVGFADGLGIGFEEFVARFTQNVPLNRAAKADELGGLCSYLASDESSFMTAAVLVIDGGAATVDVSGAAVSNIVAEAAAKKKGAVQ